VRLLNSKRGKLIRLGLAATTLQVILVVCAGQATSPVNNQASQPFSIASAARDDSNIGERPAIEKHLDQKKIESGEIGLTDLLREGRRLFEARFNALDGQGRPASTGSGVPRPTTQPSFIRTSGPDSNSCAGCHSQPRSGGAGEFTTNVFVLAQERDPVVNTVLSKDSDERGTTALMGSGAIEMLAREMSTELIAVRTGALKEALSSGSAVSRSLTSKGVSFGSITALPDGRIDPRGIQGIDWDLILKPFHQKGAVASLREFTNTALNHHFGIQSVERFGEAIDIDQDGKADELTIGDVTALTVFQAALDTPGRIIPADTKRRLAAERGEVLFETIKCTNCHVPALTLDHPAFVEPGPFNPQGNLHPGEVDRSISFDLTQEGIGPRIERLANGEAVVRLFSDLKRHDLNDKQYHHFANEMVPQGTLSGSMAGLQYTEAPKPRPTSQFLTRPLWGVGNTDPYGHRGDLTTLTEAIFYHGGEARSSRDAFFDLPISDRAAVVEFLKSLQILPPGAPSLVIKEQIN
jgi:cytochrome c peroxidase